MTLVWAESVTIFSEQPTETLNVNQLKCVKCRRLLFDERTQVISHTDKASKVTENKEKGKKH